MTSATSRVPVSPGFVSDAESCRDERGRAAGVSGEPSLGVGGTGQLRAASPPPCDHRRAFRSDRRTLWLLLGLSVRCTVTQHPASRDGDADSGLELPPSSRAWPGSRKSEAGRRAGLGGRGAPPGRVGGWQMSKRDGSFRQQEAYWPRGLSGVFVASGPAPIPGGLLSRSPRL